MKIETHQQGEIRIAEIRDEGVVIKSAADGLDLLGTIYYDGYDAMILHESNLTDEFFDLKSGIAGEILQKFSNYRMRLAIIGDFSKYTGKSIKDFIFESNKGGHINFVGSLEEALNRLS